MCLCEKLKSKKEICVNQGNWIDLYIDHNEEGYYIKALGDGISWLRINYCPLCGKELKEEK